MFITEFNEEFNIARNIQSQKIDIKNKRWIIYDAKVYNNNGGVEKKEIINFESNFDYIKIQSL